MILIDLNEAIEQIIEDKIPEDHMPMMKATGCGLQAETLNLACDRHIKMLDELPEVDAIPIEWIKKWKEKAADGSLCRGPIDLFDHYEYEEAIDRLLSDWKEENE